MPERRGSSQPARPARAHKGGPPRGGRAARRRGRRTRLHVLAELVDVGAARLGQQHVVAEVVDLHLLKVEHLVLRARQRGGPLANPTLTLARGKLTAHARHPLPHGALPLAGPGARAPAGPAPRSLSTAGNNLVDSARHSLRKGRASAARWRPDAPRHDRWAAVQRPCGGRRAPGRSWT